MLWTAVKQIENRSSVLRSYLWTFLLHGFVLAAFMDLMSSSYLFVVVFKRTWCFWCIIIKIFVCQWKLTQLKGIVCWSFCWRRRHPQSQRSNLFFYGYITILSLTVPPSSPISVIISALENKAPLSEERGGAYGRERGAQGVSLSAADTD